MVPQKNKKELQAELEQRLRSKVTHVLEWHAPQREVGSNDTLQLAKMTQLPQLLRQQVEERRRTKEEIEVKRQEIVDVLATKHKVRLLAIHDSGQNNSRSTVTNPVGTKVVLASLHNNICTMGKYLADQSSNLVTTSIHTACVNDYDLPSHHSTALLNG